MAKKFYVLDSSKDGNYRLLVGSEIKAHFESQGKSGLSFIFQKQPNGDVIGIEIPKDKQKDYKAEKNRREYIRRVMREMDISVTSLDCMAVGEDEGTGEEIIPDESADIEKHFIEREEIATLWEALNILTEEEMYIIQALYFSPTKLTERELAKKINISQPAIHKKKISILSKLKNFLED